MRRAEAMGERTERISVRYRGGGYQIEAGGAPGGIARSLGNLLGAINSDPKQLAALHTGDMAATVKLYQLLAIKLLRVANELLVVDESA
jgi:hypothetical protein